MGQKLILPKSKNKITADFMDPDYKYGDHYGVDFGWGDGSYNPLYDLYGLGIGEVIRTITQGYERVGNVLSVLYRNVLVEGVSKDLVVSYYHLDGENPYSVEIGDVISYNGDSIAVIGNTGHLKMDDHLHLEVVTYNERVDKETGNREYATQTWAQYGNYFEGSVRTIDPMTVLNEGQ